MYTVFIEEIKNQVEQEKGKKMADKEMQQKILNICKESTEKNPIVLFNRIVKNEDISIPMHGPIHHVVDGAAFLTAFFNAGGKINLEESFWELRNRAEKMPGGMCGHWGVCGAVSSVGAALSIIKKSGPLSEFDWGNHILYSSKALERLGTVGGPRCCKRNACLALDAAIDFVNENKNHFRIVLEKDKIECSFSSKNQQCIKERCPFATR